MLFILKNKDKLMHYNDHDLKTQVSCALQNQG